MDKEIPAAAGDPAEPDNALTPDTVLTPDNVLTPDAVITSEDRLFPYDKGQAPAREAVRRRPRWLRGGGRRGAAQYTQREQERGPKR